MAQTSYLFKTNENNYYYYDPGHRQAAICHPLLSYFIKIHGSGDEPKEWFQQLPPGDEPVSIDGAGTFSRSEIRYYLQKFYMLLQNGYFQTPGETETFNRPITAEIVRENLINARQIVLEVTDRCNLECEYCGYGKYYNDYDQRLDKNMDIQTAKNFFDYMTRLWNSPQNQSRGKTVFISFYGGEPLLNFPFLREFVQYAKSLDLKYNRIAFSMTTNAMLLEKHMDFLVQNQFKLLISLDGGEESNKYRVFKNGKPAYKEIIRNILALKEKYPDYFTTNVNFHSVYHNKNNVSDLHRFFMHHFNKTPVISELNTTGINPEYQKTFKETYSNIGKDLQNTPDLDTLEKEMFLRLPTVNSIDTFIHQHTNFCYQNYNDLLYPMRNTISFPTGTCSPFTRKIFLTVNGKILPCERISHRYAMGHANHNSVELNEQKIAESYNQLFQTVREVCNKCHRNMSCPRCIFNMDVDKKETKPPCKQVTSAKDYSQYLAAHIAYIEKHPATYRKIIKDVILV